MDFVDVGPASLLCLIQNRNLVICVKANGSGILYEQLWLYLIYLTRKEVMGENPNLYRKLVNVLRQKSLRDKTRDIWLIPCR